MLTRGMLMAVKGISGARERIPASAAPLGGGEDRRHAERQGWEFCQHLEAFSETCHECLERQAGDEGEPGSRAATTTPALMRTKGSRQPRLAA